MDNRIFHAPKAFLWRFFPINQNLPVFCDAKLDGSCDSISFRRFDFHQLMFPETKRYDFQAAMSPNILQQFTLAADLYQTQRNLRHFLGFSRCRLGDQKIIPLSVIRDGLHCLRIPGRHRIHLLRLGADGVTLGSLGFHNAVFYFIPVSPIDRKDIAGAKGRLIAHINGHHFLAGLHHLPVLQPYGVPADKHNGKLCPADGLVVFKIGFRDGNMPKLGFFVFDCPDPCKAMAGGMEHRFYQRVACRHIALGRNGLFDPIHQRMAIHGILGQNIPRVGSAVFIRLQLRNNGSVSVKFSVRGNDPIPLDLPVIIQIHYHIKFYALKLFRRVIIIFLDHFYAHKGVILYGGPSFVFTQVIKADGIYQRSFLPLRVLIIDLGPSQGRESVGNGGLINIVFDFLAVFGQHREDHRRFPRRSVCQIHRINGFPGLIGFALRRCHRIFAGIYDGKHRAFQRDIFNVFSIGTDNFPYFIYNDFIVARLVALVFTCDFMLIILLFDREGKLGYQTFRMIALRRRFFYHLVGNRIRQNAGNHDFAVGICRIFSNQSIGLNHGSVFQYGLAGGIVPQFKDGPLQLFALVVVIDFGEFDTSVNNLAFLYRNDIFSHGGGGRRHGGLLSGGVQADVVPEGIISLRCCYLLQIDVSALRYAAQFALSVYIRCDFSHQSTVRNRGIGAFQIQAFAGSVIDAKDGSSQFNGMILFIVFFYLDFDILVFGIFYGLFVKRIPGSRCRLVRSQFGGNERNVFREALIARHGVLFPDKILAV